MNEALPFARNLSKHSEGVPHFLRVYGLQDLLRKTIIIKLANAVTIYLQYY